MSFELDSHATQKIPGVLAPEDVVPRARGYNYARHLSLATAYTDNTTAIYNNTNAASASGTRVNLMNPLIVRRANGFVRIAGPVTILGSTVTSSGRLANVAAAASGTKATRAISGTTTAAVSGWRTLFTITNSAGVDPLQRDLFPLCDEHDVQVVAWGTGLVAQAMHQMANASFTFIQPLVAQGTASCSVFFIGTTSATLSIHPASTVSRIRVVNGNLAYVELFVGGMTAIAGSATVAATNYPKMFIDITYPHIENRPRYTI
jgi:hypothetical protein